MAKYTEAQKQAILKYQNSHARLNITLDIKQKERFQEHAQRLGISVTEMILKAVEADIKRYEQGKE